MGADGPGPSLGSPSAALPAQFGKYTIVGHLATGGMAEVYLARAAGIEGFEKTVVIKRIRPDLIGHGATTQMFLHEARLAATLEHPNIVQVHEIDIVNDSYFFAMEYVEGADLRQLMSAATEQGRALALADAAHIAIQVCSALHYAHEKRDAAGHPLGLIHRDVSPSNVLLSHDGSVKVCDFGIAKQAHWNVETDRGAIKGKFSYMAPEQFLAAPLDRRCDVFAIGILLYELSTLTRPFQADADFEVMRMIVEDEVRPPSRVKAGYPAELERIVLRALRRHPDERYPTAQAMQLELEAFAREERLALSSVHLSRLMDELFGRPGPGQIDWRVDSRPAPGAPIAGQPGGEIAPAPAPASPVRRRGVRWLAGAAISALLAGGLLAAGAWMEGSNERASHQALTLDADQIAGAIDAAIHAAHLRAEALAATPMLEAAIQTDAATLRDLAESGDFKWSPRPGEVLELFQGRESPVSLLRVPLPNPPSGSANPLPAGPPKGPAAGRAVQPVQGSETRLERVADHLVIVAAAPIAASGSAEVGGHLAISAPLDLRPLRGQVEAHASAAWLTGAGAPIPIAGSAAQAATATIPIRLSATTGESPMRLALAARVAETAAPAWMLALQIACWLAAAAMLGAWAMTRLPR